MLSGTITLGRYELHPAIASGGMASVHLGRLRGPVGFSRTVAIKRLQPPYGRDAAFVSMFVDEARLLARVQHPNVVVILDVVHEEGELFLVMEYVHGVSLARLLRPGGGEERAPVPPAIVAAVFTDVLHGLHAAHEATTAQGEPLRIVHRDATPQNILVGLDGTAKIVDFGIAKATQRVQHTQDGLLKGKLSYIAPEQLQSNEIGPWTDVYATAVSMWEALTGRPLFEAEDNALLMEKVLLGASRPPSVYVPGVAPELDDVVMRGLEIKPQKRFQTAREMALALEKAVKPSPASEIGAFVEARAGSLLAERARLVRMIESTPVAPPSDKRPSTPPATTTEIVPPKRRRKTGWILLAAAAFAIAGAVVWVRRGPARIVNAAPPDSTPAPSADPPPADLSDTAPAPLPSATARVVPVRRAPQKPCVPRRRDDTGQIYYDRNCLRDHK